MRVRERRSVQASKARLTREREQFILTALQRQSMTVRELVETTGLREARIRYVVSGLHRAGQLRVEEWIRMKCPDGKYRVAPKFTAVAGYDAAPPEGVNRRDLNLRLEPGSASLSIAIKNWF